MFFHARAYALSAGEIGSLTYGGLTIDTDSSPTPMLAIYGSVSKNAIDVKVDGMILDEGQTIVDNLIPDTGSFIFKHFHITAVEFNKP